MRFGVPTTVSCNAIDLIERELDIVYRTEFFTGGPEGVVMSYLLLTTTAGSEAMESDDFDGKRYSKIHNRARGGGPAIPLLRCQVCRASESIIDWAGSL